MIKDIQISGTFHSRIKAFRSLLNSISPCDFGVDESRWEILTEILMSVHVFARAENQGACRVTDFKLWRMTWLGRKEFDQGMEDALALQLIHGSGINAPFCRRINHELLATKYASPAGGDA